MNKTIAMQLMSKRESEMKVFKVRTNVGYQGFLLSNHHGKFWANYVLENGRLAPHWEKVSLKKIRERGPQGRRSDTQLGVLRAT
jgi:hypothetical protein